jgi:hypothetical protein
VRYAVTRGFHPEIKRRLRQHEGFAAFVRTEPDAVVDRVVLQVFHGVLAVRFQGEVAIRRVTHEHAPSFRMPAPSCADFRSSPNFGLSLLHESIKMFRAAPSAG